MKKTDLRIIKTLRQIDTALLDNLVDHSFQEITIQMICETALINRSTFYKYYSDKYDLLDSYIKRTLDEFQKNTNTEFALATPDHVGDYYYRKVFSQYIEFIFRKRREYLVMWHAQIEFPFYYSMVEIVRDCILKTLLSEKKVPNNTKDYNDLNLFAYLLASNMLNLVRWWIEHEHEITKEDVERIMTTNMQKGLFFTFKQFI